MKKVILKCRPGARFHFGKAVTDVALQLNDTSEYIHSDTLFSALVNVLAKVEPGQVDKFIKSFEDEKIKISSAFYCLEPLRSNNEWVFFLPTPVTVPNLVSKNYKEVKKIKFVSKKLIQEDIHPENWFNNDNISIVNASFVCKNEELSFLSDQKPLLNIYQKISEPKVNVRTQTKKDALFERTDIHIESHLQLQDTVHCHFWFGVEIEDKESEQLLNKALTFLVDEGIGGERSLGCGILEGYDFKEKRTTINNNKAFLNLSLTIPDSEKEFQKFNSYKLVKRGGRFVANSNKEEKKVYAQQVHMIGEGAVIKLPVKSKIVNLQPSSGSQPIYRYGKCFSYPISDAFYLQDE